MIDFSAIPLSMLSEHTKQLISTLLNAPKIIPTDDNLLRDWRGLANEVCIGGESLPLLANSSDPTGFIIAHMQKQLKCMFLDLQKILERMDRWDILSDAEKLFEKDAQQYLENKDKILPRAECLQSSAESQLLTVDDLYRYKDGLQNMHYDAFLLYAEEDYDFAKKIVDYLENTSGLKLCIKDRNLMPGLTFTHDAIMQLISERCNRLIVILSPSFLISRENAFLVTYAHAIGIDKGQRKIVPCIYKNCELPPQLRYMFVLDYRRSGFYDFWGKLRDSVKTAQIKDEPRSNVPVPDSECKKLDVNENPLAKTSKLEACNVDEDASISLPSVSRLESPGDSEVVLAKKKSGKKKYLSTCKKKLQSLLLKS